MGKFEFGAESQKESVAIFNVLKTIGPALGVIRNRIGITQKTLNDAIRKELQKDNQYNYAWSIERYSYSRSDVETVVKAMIKVLKRAYDEKTDDILKGFFKWPSWCDDVTENWIKCDLKKVNSWYEEINLWFENDTTYDDFTEMLYWYNVSFKYILDKLHMSLTEFSRFAGISRDCVYNTLIRRDFYTKMSSKAFFNINWGFERLFFFNSMPTPSWFDYIYSGDYKKASKKIKEWYIRMLENDAKQDVEMD